MMPATKEAKATSDQRRFNIGRPPLSPSGSVTLNIRLTPEQREKLNLLGGVNWIRKRIDRATAPTPEPVVAKPAAKRSRKAAVQ